MTDSVTDIGEFSHDTDGGGASSNPGHGGGCHEECAPIPHDVPEPTGAAVFGVGLLALFMFARLRRA